MTVPTEGLPERLSSRDKPATPAAGSLSQKPIDAAWIAETRALCEAATRGPWAVDTDPVGYGDGIVAWSSFLRRPRDHGHGPQFCNVQDTRSSADKPRHDPDAVLCAAARTALPAALDEIQRLSSILDAMCERLGITREEA